MQWDWQTIIAIAIVCLVCLTVMKRIRGWYRPSGTGGCTGCASSSATPAVKSLPFVDIEAVKTHARKK